jgi:hypothetical protein
MLAAALSYAQNIAVIAGMKGKITINRANRTIVAKTGETLKNNDEIQSGEESYAAIRFVDNGATTKLFPNSILVISANKSGNLLNKTNNIAKGTAHSKVTPKTGNYIVETPNTVASVKGTDFITSYENNTTTVGVYEGEVEIKSKNTEKTVSSKANEVYSVDEQGNLNQEENTDFLNQNQGAANQNLTPPAPPAQNPPSNPNILEIEIQKPDGTKKKVRITYE